jgi:branched-chain amino acid aminotransferase
MKKERLIWFKGEIMPVDEAKVNVLSPTCQFGANVFEGLRCYWNETDQELYAFRLKEHTERLLDSVKMMRFDLKYSYKELVSSFNDIVKANNYKEDIALRQTIFLDGLGSWFATGPTEMFIAPIPKARLFIDENKGIDCCVSSWERINDNSLSPKIKVGANYINSRAGQLEALRNGYDFTIFLNNQGTVSEGPGSCIFIVRDGVLITPPVTASILESITRATIIEIARAELGLNVLERDVDRTELYICDEIFLCGTAVEIVPVFSVDRMMVGSGEKGSITKNLQELYFNVVRGNVEKYKHWLTPIYKI